jgi:hypothetical protein
LDGSGTGQSELAELFGRTSPADLICFLQSDSPSLIWQIAQSLSRLWARVATFYDPPDILLRKVSSAKVSALHERTAASLREYRDSGWGIQQIA